MSCQRAQCHCDIVYTKADFGQVCFLKSQTQQRSLLFSTPCSTPFKCAASNAKKQKTVGAATKKTLSMTSLVSLLTGRHDNNCSTNGNK